MYFSKNWYKGPSMKHLINSSPKILSRGPRHFFFVANDRWRCNKADGSLEYKKKHLLIIFKFSLIYIVQHCNSYGNIAAYVVLSILYTKPSKLYCKARTLC